PPDTARSGEEQCATCCLQESASRNLFFHIQSPLSVSSIIKEQNEISKYLGFISFHAFSLWKRIMD
ncbi:MAG: hypothetical protein SOZ01_00435, partial [Selenomonadaceae bacterium]|nr:hypothetical protein [Selenomonadaceae bacterium]